jgi:hypothetical protein
MGKTAYLTKRGGVFWFRRRPPLLRLRLYLSFTATRSKGDVRGVACVRRHQAVSLRTGCPCEARRRAARVGALFERGWAAFEAVMNETTSADTAPDLQQEFARGLLEILRKNVAQAEILMGHVAPEAIMAKPLCSTSRTGMAGGTMKPGRSSSSSTGCSSA